MARNQNTPPLESQTRTLTGRQVSLVAKNVAETKQVTLRVTGVSSGATKTISVTVSPRS